MKTESVNDGWRDIWLFVLVLAAAGALFWAASWEADSEEQDHLAIFRNEVADKALISEAIIRGRLRAYDDTLLALREIYAADPAQFDKRVQWLRRGPLAEREILVVVLDREGYLAYTDSPKVTPRLDLRQRPYFRYFADGGKDRFYVDEPVFGRVTQRYSLPLARPIYDRNGAFDGVVALSISQDMLANFDPELQLSGATTISVVSARGALVTQSRDLAAVQGTTIPAERLAQLQQGSKGVFSTRSTVGEGERILAFRHIEGLPLIVYASSSPRQVLDRIAKQRTVLMSSAGAASFLVLLLALAYRQRRRITARFIATQQAHLKEAQRIAGMGSWELDLTTRRFQWSDEISTLFGVPGGGVSPDFEFFLSRVVESDRAAVMAVVENAATGGAGDLEFSLHRADGQRRELVVRFEAVRNSAGKVGSLIGTVRDITEQKRSEEARRKSEYVYRTMIDSAPEGVWMIGPDRRTTEVNQRLCKLLGYAREDMRGRDPTAFADAENGTIFQEKARLVPNRQTRTYQVALRHRDGHNIPTEFSATNLFDEDGAVMGVLAFVVDLTERKRAEAARVELEAQLRESQKMEALGTLAGGVAHDFNNALAVIMGNVELVRQDLSASHPALESLEEIDKASRRAKDLVRQILAFSRHQRPERKPTSLSLVVLESARLIRATLPATVSLDVDCSTDAPAVLADATQVEQILLNLCANVLHAVQDGARPGQIGVSLEAYTQGEECGDLPPGRYARLSIRDNGPGMDAATRARIFDPFFTTKPVGKGTGLGLSVVHGIVRAHEATIEVESTPGEGCAFHIYFPAVDAPLAQAAQPVAGAAPIHGKGKHILYVDDEEGLVLLMTRLLERQGYRVSGYTDPREALAAVRADPGQYDLAVTDYNMPHLSGLELAQALREMRADLPVVLASGYITEELRAKAPAAGVRELIYKPNTADDLCAAVARLAQAAGETA